MHSPCEKQTQMRRVQKHISWKHITLIVEIDRIFANEIFQVCSSMICDDQKVLIIQLALLFRIELRLKFILRDINQ